MDVYSPSERGGRERAAVHMGKECMRLVARSSRLSHLKPCLLISSSFQRRLYTLRGLHTGISKPKHYMAHLTLCWFNHMDTTRGMLDWDWSNKHLDQRTSFRIKLICNVLFVSNSHIVYIKQLPYSAIMSQFPAQFTCKYCSSTSCIFHFIYSHCEVKCMSSYLFCGQHCILRKLLLCGNATRGQHYWAVDPQLSAYMTSWDAFSPQLSKNSS